MNPFKNPLGLFLRFQHQTKLIWWFEMSGNLAFVSITADFVEIQSKQARFVPEIAIKNSSSKKFAQNFIKFPFAMFYCFFLGVSQIFMTDTKIAKRVQREKPWKSFPCESMMTERFMLFASFLFALLIIP